MEFIGHLRHTKGISVGIPREFRNLTAFQRDFAEDPMEFIWIPRHTKRAFVTVGIVT